MKTRLFPVVILVTAVIMAPLPVILADDDMTSGPSEPATGSTSGTGTGAQGERGARWKAVFAQLDLTEAQKAQIKQIRANFPAGKERRQQIMAVLTPDQKAKLAQMLQQYRGEKQAGGAVPAPGAN